MPQHKDEDTYKYRKRLQNVSKPVHLEDMPDAVKEYQKRVERGEIVSEETAKQREKEQSGNVDEGNWLYYCPSCNRPSIEKTIDKEGKQVFHCTYCGLNTLNPRKIANFPQRNRMF